MKTSFIALLAGCAVLGACNRAEAPSTSTPGTSSDTSSRTSTDDTGATTRSGTDSSSATGTGDAATGTDGMRPGAGTPLPRDDQRPNNTGAGGSPR